MNLPKDIGGYQHLAPNEIIKEGDIAVHCGVPIFFMNIDIGRTVGLFESLFDRNVYRKIPVAKQGDSDHAAARKATPVYSGFMKYFPLAIAEVARVSQAGNDQHNPGKPLHWDRSKSGDELDAASRHLLEAGTFDTDGQRHTAKLAWRAMAALQKELEAYAKP